MKRFLLFGAVLLLTSFVEPAQKITVGSKHFTEGYLVSEMIAQLLEANGFQVTRKFNLGGTSVCYSALRNREIDVYPEYSGTVSRELLRLEGNPSIADLEVPLAGQGIGISPSFGFNNSYGFVVTQEVARTWSLARISDLAGTPSLRAGISYEFLKRRDGWETLAKEYQLALNPVGIEHGLAYAALVQGQIDLTDCYTTDGEIARHSLVLLEDDRGFFPSYEAVALYRQELPDPAKAAIASLAGVLDERGMQKMNLAAISEKEIAVIARDFLVGKGLIRPETSARTSGDLASNAVHHLLLTFLALLAAVVVAVPLGVWIYWNPKAANIVLYLAGLLQTVPSIALLAFMIPLFGIGFVPAVVALFLYALLPILRNTVTGLRSVDSLLKEVAVSLGMTRYQSLRIVEAPLALPAILTGVRVAAVISVGTATLAAFIGAGGFGEYIVTGLALNNTNMILQGAGASAAMAIGIELLFEVLERTLLRQRY